MIFIETTLKDAWIVEPELRGDDRGFFARTMCAADFEARGLAFRFVQQNTSFSAHRGTLRGMHFQRGADAEAKFVRCIKGAIYDVIVDMRADSPTYGRHQGFELSEENRRHLYVPPGFAHSFQTLTDDVEVTYLVSAPYTPSAEGGLRYNDPALAIAWPLPVSVISDKDASWALVGSAPLASM